jgi:hypothetical protein
MTNSGTTMVPSYRTTGSFPKIPHIPHIWVQILGPNRFRAPKNQTIQKKITFRGFGISKQREQERHAIL